MCTNETTTRWGTIATAMVIIAGTLGSLKEASAQDQAPSAKERQAEQEATKKRRATKDQEAAEEKELKGNFDVRLDADDQDANAGGNVTMMMTENNNGTEYSVHIENGKTTAQRDGNKLSKDQYRVKGGKIEFLDADGNVEHTMQMPSMGRPGQNVWRISPRAASPLAPAAPAAPLARIANPPPVMLGITMSDHDDGAMIDSVRDGLPADKAGLKEGDVITTIDGEKIADQDDVRSALKDHKDGDKVDVVVLRDGEKKTIKVALEKWDYEKLGVNEAPQALTIPGVPAAPDADPFGGNQWWKNFMGGDSAGAIKEAREALEAALEQVDAAKDNIEDLRKAAKDGLESAITSLKEAEESAKHRTTIIAPNQDGIGGRGWVLPLNNNRRAVERDDEVRKQLDELRQQMRELSKQMEEHNKKKDDR